MTEPEIKSCPFCGDDVEEGDSPVVLPASSSFEERENRLAVYCPNCGARGPEIASEAEAIAAWNRRAAPLEAGTDD